MQNARAAEDRLDEALEELHTLDTYCVDPVAGLALIPFAEHDRLAWFIYDLFDEQPLRTWRYHTDPLEKRRSVSELLEAAGDKDKTAEKRDQR